MTAEEVEAVGAMMSADPEMNAAALKKASVHLEGVRFLPPQM